MRPRTSWVKVTVSCCAAEDAVSEISLSPVVMHTMNTIVAKAMDPPEPKTIAKYVEERKQAKNDVTALIEIHREKVYNILISAAFIDRFPQMKQIMLLKKTSPLAQCVIMLSGLGMTTKEISDLMLSDKHSVSTMRSNTRKIRKDIF